MSLVGVEAVAHGRKLDLTAPPPKCEHRGAYGLDGVSAVVLDERGEIDRREVRVRVRCMLCGAPMGINLDTVRRPKEGEPHGIVLVLEPLEEG